MSEMPLGRASVKESPLSAYIIPNAAHSMSGSSFVPQWAVISMLESPSVVGSILVSSILISVARASLMSSSSMRFSLSGIESVFSLKIWIALSCWSVQEEKRGRNPA